VPTSFQSSGGRSIGIHPEGNRPAEHVSVTGLIGSNTARLTTNTSGLYRCNLSF
jgi:hypothetical protein